MTKIKTGHRIIGSSPFSRRAVKGAFTGKKVPKGVVSNSGVRRMFARDPSKRNSLIGTRADVNPNTKNATVGVPRPRVLKAPRTALATGKNAMTATPSGVKKVIARSNRSLRRR